MRRVRGEVTQGSAQGHGSPSHSNNRGKWSEVTQERDGRVSEGVGDILESPFCKFRNSAWGAS